MKKNEWIPPSTQVRCMEEYPPPATVFWQLHPPLSNTSIGCCCWSTHVFHHDHSTDADQTGMATHWSKFGRFLLKSVYVQLYTSCRRSFSVGNIKVVLKLFFTLMYSVHYGKKNIPPYAVLSRSGAVPSVEVRLSLPLLTGASESQSNPIRRERGSGRATLSVYGCTQPGSGAHPRMCPSAPAL